MKRLLMYDYFRGTDSTGFASLQNYQKVPKIAKIASHPLDLFEMKRFISALNGTSCSVFLGHNRAATKGVVNNANAHPFQCDHIIGAHNGTLTAESFTALKKAIGEETGTDSEAIFIAIAKLGLEETVAMLQGAWALVWFNLEDNTLNFLRNKERTFWYAYSKKFDKVFWASEYWMIQSATQSDSTIELFVDEAEGHKYKFFATQVDYHYKYDLEKLRAGATERPKPRCKKIEGKEPAPVKPAGASNFPHYGYTPHTTPPVISGTNSTNTTTSSLGEPKTTDRITKPWDRFDPCGGAMNGQTAFMFAGYGCSWCYGDIDMTKPGITVFPESQKMLCHNCTGAEHNRIYVPESEMEYIALPRLLTAQ